MKCYTSPLKLEEHEFTQLNIHTAEMYEERVASTSHKTIPNLFKNEEQKLVIFILPLPPHINIKSARSATNFS